MAFFNDGLKYPFISILHAVPFHLAARNVKKGNVAKLQINGFRIAFRDQFILFLFFNVKMFFLCVRSVQLLQYIYFQLLYIFF